MINLLSVNVASGWDCYFYFHQSIERNINTHGLRRSFHSWSGLRWEGRCCQDPQGPQVGAAPSYQWSHAWFPALPNWGEKWNLPMVTAWMDLEGIMLSEISQRKIKPYAFIYMFNLKNKINRSNWNRLVDTENRQMVSREEKELRHWVKKVKELKSKN